MLITLIPPENQETCDDLKMVLTLPGVGGLFQDALSVGKYLADHRHTTLFVPSNWLALMDRQTAARTQEVDSFGLSLESLQDTIKQGILIINGRRLYRCDRHKLRALFSPPGSSVVAVYAAPELTEGTELARLTLQHQIVGFRRLFEDMIEPTSDKNSEFPQFLYFPPEVVRQLKKQKIIPLDIKVLRQHLAEMQLPIRYFRIGAEVNDLNTSEGMLCLLDQIDPSRLNRTAASASIAPSARLVGPVWIGSDVRIDEEALIVGPAIVGDKTVIGKKAVIQNAIIGPNVEIKSDDFVAAAIYTRSHSHTLPHTAFSFGFRRPWQGERFRRWPVWSYPRLGKRIFDLAFSLCILLLVSPILLIVAGLVKLTSKGPVFYRARRQGLHGKEFNCLKFRTMMVQADTLQERLRVVNQVDGPQFKIDNDPRITGLGQFLRDTCIDELPQFFNVLAGQMSVVGPRPSPENENESCPAWRDARLSVRPGITGLWQLYRTRQEGQDFQEWVYYDTQYVRNVSFRLDLSICMKTAAKLINTFLDQFG